jgi:hypothetical protein
VGVAELMKVAQIATAQQASFGGLPGAALWFGGPATTPLSYYTFPDGNERNGQLSAGLTDMVHQAGWSVVVGTLGSSGLSLIDLGRYSWLFSDLAAVGNAASVIAQESPGINSAVMRFGLNCHDGYSSKVAGSLDSASVFGLLLGNQCQAKLVIGNAPTAPGTVALTGVGFQPDLVVFGQLTSIYNAATGGSGGVAPYGSQTSYGVADKLGNQWVAATQSQSSTGAAAPPRYRQFTNGQCMRCIASSEAQGPSYPNMLASLVSMDADGWTLNWSQAAANGNGQPFIYVALAIKVASGNGVRCGVAHQGDGSIPVGWAPSGMVFVGCQTPDQLLHSDAVLLWMGAMDGLNQCCSWVGGNQNDGSGHSTVGYMYYDTGLAISAWKGDGAGVATARALAALTNVGCNLAWTVDDGSKAPFGWIAFDIDTTPFLYPSVATMPVTGLGPTAATLNGNVNPEGSGNAYFQWGSSTAYGQTTANIPLSGTVNVGVAANLTGLVTGTTYHYRAVFVASDSCVYYGADHAFTPTNVLGPISLHKKLVLGGPNLSLD